VIFDVIRDLKPSWRGELEITDALQMLIDRGLMLATTLLGGGGLILGRRMTY
jgi:glucose-1-phosphate thymidylyltransferase